jgi:hypothetical protein
MNELYYFFFFFLFRLNDRELCIGPVTHDNFVVTTHETKRNEKKVYSIRRWWWWRSVCAFILSQMVRFSFSLCPVGVRQIHQRLIAHVVPSLKETAGGRARLFIFCCVKMQERLGHHQWSKKKKKKENVGIQAKSLTANPLIKIKWETVSSIFVFCDLAMFLSY